MSQLDASAVALASTQHGLATITQLRSLGATTSTIRRRAAAGHWSQICPRVYAIGAAPPTFHRDVMAALLAAGPGALVSHRTALRLWGLDRRVDTPIEVTIPRGRSHTSAPIVCHESRDLSLAKPTVIDGIRVTGLIRTLIDLGAVEPWRVRWAIWAARRTHDLAWEDMARALHIHARPGRRGTGPFRRVLEQHFGEIATDSGTEDLAFAILFDCGRVPIPVKQLPITLPNGITVHGDLGWPRHKVVLEIQGVDHFTNEDLQQLDLQRRNQLELAGYRVLLYSGRSVRKDPDRFVEEVRAILSQNPPIH